MPDGHLSENSDDAELEDVSSVVDEPRAIGFKVQRGYILALVIVAVIDLGSGVLLNQWLKSQQETGHWVNLAGRQRMLSERILRLSQSQDHRGLAESCAAFEAAHGRLFGGEEPVAGPPGAKLESAQRSLLEDASKVMKGATPPPSMALTQHDFVTQMERVVNELDQRAERSVRELRLCIWIIGVILLMVLLTEAAFIFRPLVVEISSTTRRLFAANQALRLSQQQLRDSNEQLRRSNQDLQEFSWAASHDLKESLRTTSMFLDLLAKQSIADLGAESRSHLEFALNGSRRTQAMLDGLGSLLEAGPTGMLSSGTSARQAVDHAVRNLAVDIDRSGAVVAIDVKAQLEVVMPMGQLIRVFQNLLSNAILYRSEGDTEARIRIEARADSDWLTFSVSDNGLGIEEAYRERIFLPFKRLHTASEFPGSGLGLTYCVKAVEGYGGRIWVEANQAEGSVFRFTVRAH